jgi:hypothetical protein
MWEFITGRHGQRIAAMAAILGIQYSLGIEWDDIRVWCLLAMVMILEYLAFYHGITQGIESILNLSSDNIEKLKKLLKDVESGQEVFEEDIKKILDKKETKDE